MAIVTAIVVVRLRPGGSSPTGPPCRVADGPAIYGMDLDQAANATTIAAIGKKLSMPDHAVTVALAAALQESKLRNVEYGDLDSLGLFQQRPSQGWGTPAQIMDPRYATTAFYRRLAQVNGWQSLSVSAAAQQVQHSAAPDAYAGWEQEARALAAAMTGEAPAGLSCRAPVRSDVRVDPGLMAAMTAEVGVSDATRVTSTIRGWILATWLVGHAAQYHIHSVAFAGQGWTGRSAVWQPTSVLGSGVSVS